MVLAVVDDLLFSSKIRAVAAAVERVVFVVRNRADVIPAIRERQPSLVIFDLDRDVLDPIGLIAEIRAAGDITGTKLVGFGSHVHADRLKAAKAAGCDRVLARSGFVADLPGILRAAPEQPIP